MKAVATNTYIPYYVLRRMADSKGQIHDAHCTGFLLEQRPDAIVLASIYIWPTGQTRPTVAGVFAIPRNEVVEHHPCKSAVASIRVDGGVEEAVVLDAGVASTCNADNGNSTIG